LFRLLTPSGEYLCAAEPTVRPGSELQTVLAQIVTEGAPPTMLHWDGVTPSGQEIVWGDGGIDSTLAESVDLGACWAVRADALERVAVRSARSEAKLREAMLALLRSPAGSSRACPGLLGRVDPRSRLRSEAAASAVSAERISIALMLTPQAPDPSAFLEAVSGQKLSSRTELIVVGEGLSGDVWERAVRIAESWSPPRRVRVRRYSFADDVPVTYVRNTLVGLAIGDAVVFADPRVAPGGSDVLQALADWAASGAVAAACPRLEHGGALLAAGLGLDADQGGGIRVDREAALSRVVRQVAAPIPWLFAANRRLWLQSGGLRPGLEPGLWTAAFAEADGPDGRALLIGEQPADWIADALPMSATSSVALRGAPRAEALRALRAASKSAPAVEVRAARPVPPPTPTPRAATLPAPQRSAAPPPMLAFDDEARPGARRLLVFADAFGPSQAIAFQLGLAEARDTGRLALRVLEEAALGGDGRALNRGATNGDVQRLIQESRPDVLVASRLGHPEVWAAVRAEARRTRTPLVMHLDDDLFDLPLSAGIERYRLARAPRRLATLQAGLEQCDLVLAATPVLAARLKRYAPSANVYALSSGAAASPPTPRAADAGRVRVGYMGSASHDADLAMIVPALNALTDAFPGVELELFGSIAEQPSASLLTGLRARHPAVHGDYRGFKRRLAQLRWDIGLAPLRSLPFNRAKTPIKWAEYAEAGAAVLASSLEPYAKVGEHGAALLVQDDGWAWALRRAVQDARLRRSLQVGAARLIEDAYSWRTLGQEVQQALELATTAAQMRSRAEAA
jgi:glycosyltransferase involved in cell wall biosynthesis